MTGAGGDEDLLAGAVALTRLPELGPARLAALLRTWSPAEAWRRIVARAAHRHAAVAATIPVGAHAALASRWQNAAREIEPADELARCRRLGIDVHVVGGPGYPDALVRDPEAPAVLFSTGRLDVLTARRVAIVGTRRATEIGLEFAVELGRDLACAGVCVVSGLATGIDAAAHRGALTNADGAAPVGVVASGLDVTYPVSSSALWRDVAFRGAVLSEAPPGTRPDAWRFPARNRIMAALAEVVVVVESRRTGGSMLTVDAALARGRAVMAVPGSVRSPASHGSNLLLADGASVVCSADDVLVALGFERPITDTRLFAPERTAAVTLPPDDEVLRVLRRRSADLDTLVRATGLDLASVALAVTRLQAEGLVTASGGWFEGRGAAGH